MISITVSLCASWSRACGRNCRRRKRKNKADIAERVGIKAPSIYKHYKSKQAIFDAIIEEMNRRFFEEAGALNINGADASADAKVYKHISE
ncbi:MAG: TetR/AcrR family transcriptional regulator, partial [Lachnospiraceae bacterium]|nr:TetR/AcrR family transcriptional regulator [Lachnospiraceae bacterium]